MMRCLLTCVFLILLGGRVPAGYEAAVKLDAATRERCLKILREGLHGSEFWPAMHAAEGLTIAGQKAEVVAFLKPQLATQTDDQHRCGLARELVRAGDRSGVPVLLQILEGPNDYGHTHAAESLFKVFESGDQSGLRRGMAQNQNLKLKMMCAGALYRAGDKSAIETIRGMLSHEDPRHAEVAAWLVGQVGDASDIPRLSAQVARQTDPLAKAYIQHALALLGDPQGRDALVANLDSHDKLIRTYAANFAGDARAYVAQPKLIQLLDDPWLDTRIRAAQSLLTWAAQPIRK